MRSELCPRLGACGGRVFRKDGSTESSALAAGHKSAVTSVAWGPSAQWLVSGSMDRNLKFWGA